MQDRKVVSVVFRFRPQQTGALDVVSSFRKQSKSTLQAVFPAASSYYREGKRVEDFPCDLILDPVVDLNGLYQLTVDQCVQNLFQKKNALILLYGNTGSGKTYTIHGDNRQEGILLHSLRRIFDISQQQPEKYYVKVSMIGVYEESSVDLLGPSAEPKGDYSPSNNPQYTEQVVTSFLQGRSALSKGITNEKAYESRERRVAADSHVICVIRLIQYVNGMEKPIAVMRIVDLAGCELTKTMNNRGKFVWVPKRSSVSLQMLLKCVASLSDFHGEKSVLSVSNFHFCQLTVLLKEHFISAQKGNVVLIHTLENEEKETDAMARALFSLLPVLAGKEKKKEEGDGVLCSQCQEKWDILEEQIREKVVRELLQRRLETSTHPQKYSVFMEFQKLMNESKSLRTNESTEVRELLRRYDEDMLLVTADLEKKSAEVSSLRHQITEKEQEIQSLSNALGEKKAEILQLNRLVSLLKKSQPRWVGPNESPPKSPANNPSNETPSLPRNFTAKRELTLRKPMPRNSPPPVSPPKFPAKYPPTLSPPKPAQSPSPSLASRSPSVSPSFPRKSPAVISFPFSTASKQAKAPPIPSLSPARTPSPPALFSSPAAKSASSPGTPVLSPAKATLPPKPFSSPNSPALSPAKPVLPKPPPPPPTSTLPQKRTIPAKTPPPLPSTLKSRYFAIDPVTPEDMLNDAKKERKERFESVDSSDSSQGDRVYPHGSTIVNRCTIKQGQGKGEKGQMTIKDMDELAGTIRMSELEATMGLGEEVRVSDVLRDSFMDELLEEAMNSV